MVEQTGQWHVAAENPDQDADLYESESRQEYAPIEEYLPTSEKNKKKLGGLDAMIVQVVIRNNSHATVYSAHSGTHSNCGHMLD